jgi:hypothetical protein
MQVPPHCDEPEKRACLDDRVPERREALGKTSCRMMSTTSPYLSRKTLASRQRKFSKYSHRFLRNNGDTGGSWSVDEVELPDGASFQDSVKMRLYAVSGNSWLRQTCLPFGSCGLLQKKYMTIAIVDLVNVQRGIW